MLLCIRTSISVLRAWKRLFARLQASRGLMTEEKQACSSESAGVGVSGVSGVSVVSVVSVVSDQLLVISN